jgi:uncharacterized protein (DUF427 family)
MESVWDYPRPPRAERSRRRVRVILGGVTIADSNRAWRVLETSHPPTIYVPPADIAPGALTPSGGRGSLCEFKGTARYLDVTGGGRSEPRAAWSYPDPVAAYVELCDHAAFYPSRMDACLLDDELVSAQDGDFYGGWITTDIVGPFKGAPGTLGW